MPMSKSNTGVVKATSTVPDSQANENGLSLAPFWPGASEYEKKFQRLRDNAKKKPLRAGGVSTKEPREA